MENGLIFGNHLGENENTKLFMFFRNIGGFNSQHSAGGFGGGIGGIGFREDDEKSTVGDMRGHSAGLPTHSMQRGQLNLFCFCGNAICFRQIKCILLSSGLHRNSPNEAVVQI